MNVHSSLKIYLRILNSILAVLTIKKMTIFAKIMGSELISRP